MYPPLSKAAWRTLQALRGHPLFERLVELEQTQWWPLERLRLLQTERLRALLAHAGEHVPYYRELFGRLRFDPRSIRQPQDLAQLPVLTKAIVREQGQRMWDERLRGRAPYVRQTSGSTGRPLRVIADKAGSAAGWAPKYRGHRWYGLDVGAKSAWVWRRDHPGLAGRKESLVHWLQNELVLPCNAQLDAPAARTFYARCLRFRPRLLYGYPSGLARFAELVQELELDGRALGLELALGAGECLLDEHVAWLREVFGVPVIAEYGCTELGILAFPCPEQGAQHLTAEHHVVEAQAMDGGASREILVTGLMNRAMPLIRYQLGDEIVPAEAPCRCGRGLPALARVAGRASAYLRRPDGLKVNAIELVQLIKKTIPMPAVRQIRIIQEDATRLTAEIATLGARPVPEAQTLVIAGLRELAGPAMTCAVRWVEEIASEPSGKRASFISQLPSREPAQAVAA